MPQVFGAYFFVFWWVGVERYFCKQKAKVFFNMENNVRKAMADRREKMVAWAASVVEPLNAVRIQDLKIKHNKDVGCYDFTYNGGSGVFASASGVSVELQLFRAGRVEQYIFAKDCEEVLNRNVRELLKFDWGLVQSLIHMLKTDGDGKKMLLGEGVAFECLMDFVGVGMGLYYELGHVRPNCFAVARFEEAEKRCKEFQESLNFKVISRHK